MVHLEMFAPARTKRVNKKVEQYFEFHGLSKGEVDKIREIVAKQDAKEASTASESFEPHRLRRSACSPTSTLPKSSSLDTIKGKKVEPSALVS